MMDYQFVPQDISVTPGTTVRWTNLDGEAHDTVADNGLWGSEYLAMDQSFSYTFTDDSFQTFTYLCTLHGGMFGSVAVVVPEPSAMALLCGVALFLHRRLNQRRARLR